MPVNGRALTATAIGTLFIWSGVKGWSILGSIGDLVSGKVPSQPVINPLQLANDSGASQGLGDAPSGLAGIATQYIGHAYRYGGSPGPDGNGKWDCSSFMNFVIGIKAGRAIPGYSAGKYNGKVHGPTTAQWALWNGMSTISRSQVTAGDILVWGAHMGMATSNTSYISAHSPKLGTTITAIPKSGLGPLVRIGRLK
jgi:cell wall-associated NlpC family hydrolase